MDVSLPGSATLPTAGVTTVGVSQVYRRRGLLRAMMNAGLDDAVERGEAVAMLWASESGIYGRFGFGVAAPTLSYRVERGLAFHDLLDPQLVEPATTEQAHQDWPQVYDAVRADRGGCVSRNPEAWRMLIEVDPPAFREGASAKHLVHVPGRGYAVYRLRGDQEAGLPAGEVRILELVASDPDAEAALWQHVCDIDLTSTVRAGFRPVDDALLHLVVDPLRLRTTMGPPLYARLLDIARAFSSRGYGSVGTVTFAVTDATRDQSGTYRLDASPDGAEVVRVSDEPELSMPVDVAASVWLGGVRATHLLAARRLVEHTPGAAARFDRLLAVDRLPWTPWEF